MNIDKLFSKRICDQECSLESVTKSVENNWIKDNWESTLYNVLGMQHTTHLFLIWCVQGHAKLHAFYIQAWLINNLGMHQ